MPIKRTSLTITLAAATALAFTLPALAQQEGYGAPGGQPGAGAQPDGAPPAQAAPPAAPPQVQAEDIDETKLEAFAAAFVEVDKIRGEYEPQLQGVEDPEQAMEIQREANEQMVEAIEREGLDPQEYNAIAMAAGPDEELRNKLLNMIEERQKSGS